MNTWQMVGFLAMAIVPAAPGAGNWVQNSEDLKRIEQALPSSAVVQPKQARRLLIFTLNVGYGGHPSMAHANEAFSLMGKKTGAFETEVSNDPSLFEMQNLRRFDAVFFNNTVGNCFTNRTLRRNLLGFVTGGGGLLGVHGTTVAFTQWPGAIEDWPEFGYLIGARGANHKDSTEHIWIRRDDPQHPLTAVFGAGPFEYRDEFFRPQDPYSRDRVRVLLSIDTTKTDVKAGQARGNCDRADNDYALAWVRNYGRGRVFYSTIAHNPYVFWDPQMLRFYLAALQFALGDLAAPTTPSARLTPALRAQERLGWRLGLSTGSAASCDLSQTVVQARQLGLAYVGGSGSQLVSSQMPEYFDPRLSDDQLDQVRLMLEGAGVRLLTYSVARLPADGSGLQRLFEFGRKLGIETFVAEADPTALDLAREYCEQYGINLALRPDRSKGGASPMPPVARRPSADNGTGKVGAVLELGTGSRSSNEASRALRKLQQRVQVVNLAALGADGDTRILEEIQRLGITPTLFSLECTAIGPESLRAAREQIDRFNETCLRLSP
jgi:type 1 glutamine amidotransferase